LHFVGEWVGSPPHHMRLGHASLQLFLRGEDGEVFWILVLAD
jgi:hypothetical protein